MKKITLLAITAVFSGFLSAQIPSGYYDGTENLTGYALKTKLKNIVNEGAVDRGYGALMTAYQTGDIDKYYENDNTILDIYSEIPDGTDPYVFIPGQKVCGNYTYEGDCYNREHLFPQGFFNNAYPMRSDYFHIYPTDGKVNGYRNNYPFGTVGTLASAPSTISNPTKNGSKLGKSNFPGFSGTVFEPIDEFKGDIARALLYFITRYEDRLQSFDISDSNNPQDGSKDRGFEQWYINLLLKWNNDDPVSQKEIDRNDFGYTYQNNRNPFVDHPEFVEKIWTSTLSAQETEVLDKVYLAQNPVKNGMLVVTGNSLGKISKASIYSINGQLLQTVDHPFRSVNYITLKNTQSGIYILQLDQQNVKFIIQ